MGYALQADLVVLLHILFVLFVVLGGLAVWHWPRLAWLHLPAVIWGVAIEVTGRLCPLTHLENRLRRLEGTAGYGGSCIEHYLEPVLYPLGLTAPLQTLLGLMVLLLNAAVYGHLWQHWRRRRGSHKG